MADRGSPKLFRGSPRQLLSEQLATGEDFTSLQTCEIFGLDFSRAQQRSPCTFRHDLQRVLCTSTSELVADCLLC